MGSGSISLPSRGSFHLSLTVLVRYRSVASIQPWRVGPPDSGGVSRVPSYLGYRWDSQCFEQGAVTRYGAPFQTPTLAVLRPCPGPATPRGKPRGLGYFRFRSPLLTESSFLSSPPATEMFHFAGCRVRWPMDSAMDTILEDGGLPHSEISGSKTACVSPELIAACRVLLRLPPPRHPPYARTVWTPKSWAPGLHWHSRRTEWGGGGPYLCPDVHTTSMLVSCIWK